MGKELHTGRWKVQLKAAGISGRDPMTLTTPSVREYEGILIISGPGLEGLLQEVTCFLVNAIAINVQRGVCCNKIHSE